MSTDLPIQILNQIANKPVETNMMQMFQQDPALKILLAVLNLIPGGNLISAGAEATMAIYNQMAMKRQAALFQELQREPYRLTEVIVQSEEFIHKFLITYRAAMMTSRKEKIEYFARLLKASTVLENEVSTDEFEEYLNILSDLSFRELQILSITDKYFTEYPEPSERLDDNTSNPAWNEWAKEFFPKFRAEIQKSVGIRDEEMDDILIRISRSGLYKQIDYIDGDNGNGTLTPLFYRIKELIMI
mgnify:CR=1 FL=1